MGEGGSRSEPGEGNLGIHVLSLPHTMNSNANASITDSTLTRRVADLVERLQAGEKVDLKEFCSDSPEQFEQLEMLLPTLQAVVDLEHSLAHVGESLRSEIRRGEDSHGATDSVVRGSPEPAHPAMLDSPPLQGVGTGEGCGLLGDFRILREVGRGGMGVVYEAEQISLGRRVALKVLPFAAMLDRQQLARFKNEARAAATLDHPNIVAIYSVGAERGVHYYAMQLIEGQSLAQVVEQLRRESSSAEEQKSSRGVEQQGGSDSTSALPLYRSTALSSADTEPIARLTTLPNFSSKEYFKTIAQLGIQAAEALDHAHQNGILHRDIKPANLLVECPEPGLPSSIQSENRRGDHPASRIEHPKLWITDFGLARMEQDAGMTMTGDLLGTLRYMSPEQALAKRVVVDHRSDTYSLGVTLYELLTLQPAYAASDRQELLRQIAFDEPRKPRQIKTHIPLELETIILKAIEKNPEHRYATAGELATDLRNFLDNKPIKAKPPAWSEKLIKWSRRHQNAVFASAVVLAITTIGLAAGSILIARARNSAVTARNEAREHFQLARETIDSLTTRIAEDDALNTPQMEPLRRDLLTDAANFYEQMVRRGSNDAALRFENVIAKLNASEALVALNRAHEARELERDAMRELRWLADAHPEIPKYQAAFVQYQQSLGNAAARSGRYRDAAKHLQAAVAEAPGDVGLGLKAALLLLLVNDRAGHEQICRRLLHDFGGTKRGDTARQISFACLMSSPPVGKATEISRLNDIALKGLGWNKLELREYGLALYRAGDWEELLNWCEECRRYHDGWGRYMHCNAILEAIALQRLGKTDEARTAYNESIRHITTIFPNWSQPDRGLPENDYPADSLNYMYFRLLHREAKPLFERANAAHEPVGSSWRINQL
jgi:serine/threonine protein kinase